ncbi:hypothetical protein [Pseudomonas sp. R5(2019)]|uniref:hypothetical protein n=1 Tax=Pseudomonas sp. R5(2019) TaxID=2697566 RepID=UPI001411E4EA|nr:hypothetical protein [Pseudomonas sp. R5(2019)]NBA93423.1 hypothetical protein [Pseudomonas sp. R5(2019)]
MNTAVKGLMALVLGLLIGSPAQAASPPAKDLIIAMDYQRPGPIQRANPNSRQGSVRATPPVRSPSTQPIQRTPNLENRGIGNGDNLRREQQPPRLTPQSPPRTSDRP